MKKFKPSLTGETKFIIGFLLFFWIVGTWISFDNNSLRETVNISLLTFIFCFAFGYGWFKQSYLVIDDNQVKYVSFFFQREVADISDIKVVTTSIVAEFMKSLCVIHNCNGKEKLMQISPVGFSKEVLNDFVSELLMLNPEIEIHKSVEELLANKANKALATYRVIGLSGIAISFILMFVGIFYGKGGMLALFIPFGGLLGMFFIGYSMKGRIKNAFKFAFYFIIFSLVVILINLLT